MIKYLKESFIELNNVSWPTRKRGIKITTIVFVFMIISAAVFGFVDYLFSSGIKSLISVDQTVLPSDVTPTTDISPTDIDVSPIEITPSDATPEIAPLDPSSSENTSTDLAPANATTPPLEVAPTDTLPQTLSGENAAPSENSAQPVPSDTNPSQ